MDGFRAVAEEGDVIGIRQVVEVKIFPHLDTLRTSNRAFKDEVGGAVKQCRKHVIALSFTRLLFLGLSLALAFASRRSIHKKRG